MTAMFCFVVGFASGVFGLGALALWLEDDNDYF